MPALTETLTKFFSQRAPLASGELLHVAFSGGPDSLALVHCLAAIAQQTQWSVKAIHVDHQLDIGSSERANQARELATRIGVAYGTVTAQQVSPPPPGSSPEEAARLVRYLALQLARRQDGAIYTATAHHREDQLDTILMRWLQGSGLRGLRGMDAIVGPIVRPCLELPRQELSCSLASTDLCAVDDPSNRNLQFTRNRVSTHIRPALGASDIDFELRLLRFAARAGRAERSLQDRLLSYLSPDVSHTCLQVSRCGLQRLPRPLLPYAVRALHEQLNARAAARASVIGELARQLSRPAQVRCHCPDNWEWVESGDQLTLRKRCAPTPHFEYTVSVPGEVRLEELQLKLSIRKGSAEPWVFQGSASRAAFDFGDLNGHRIIIRNRRAGDTVQPFGHKSSKKLKRLLIDRKVPQEKRASIPLLCLDETIAWVPGVTQSQRFRVTDPKKEVWIATITQA